MGHELGARAVIVLHENGQVLYRCGWIKESEFPTMAALISAMVATGRSLAQLGDNFPNSPSRFSCDAENMGLYTVAVTPEIWLSVLYEQPLNPGKFRMKVRHYSELLGKLGLSLPQQWSAPKKNSSNGRNLAPMSRSDSTLLEKITPTKSSLFANITDQEIDDIFDNPNS